MDALNFEHSQIACQQICLMADMIRDRFTEVAMQLQRPFLQLKPRLFPDGDKWCALYGENLQEGVAGFGDTPEQAAIQFDITFLNSRITFKKKG